MNKILLRSQKELMLKMDSCTGYKDLRLNISYQTVNVIDSLKYVCISWNHMV